MAWQFILTDLYGAVHGELTQASGRKVSLPHKGIPGASCVIPIWHSLATTAVTTDCLLKAYRTDANTGTKTLAFHGPVISSEESGGSGSNTIALTAAGPYWRVQKRIIPSSKLVSGVQYGSSSSLVDLGTIARTIMTDINATHFTGIDLGTQTSTATGWVGKWFLKNAAEGIAELSAGLNTFEFRVRPTEIVAYANTQNWPRIGLFDVAPTIGSSKLDAIFEYGTTRANVSQYTRTRSSEGILTDALISVSGWPDTIEKDSAGADKYHLIERSDSTTINSRGLFEEVVNDAGILDDTLRTSVADYHILIRKQPREQITFSPSPNSRPAPFVDYDVGDTVRARAVVSNTLRFDALFRIWGLDFEVDENGNETVNLSLVTP